MQWVAIAFLCALGLYIVQLTMINLGVLVDWSVWNRIGDVLNYGFYFIPIDTFLWCLGVVLTVQNAHLIWAGMTWLLRRIPGQG